MKPTIVMQTDFSKDISVSTMHGVCQMVDPELRVSDSTHEIKPFDTYQASTSLDFVVPFWPAGTIFVSVVDPGVGTARKAAVAKLANGSYVVSPDNGSLTHLNRTIGIDSIREIDESKHRLESTKGTSIFHGRDIFAYTAAKLASGIISFEDVGPLYDTKKIILHPLWSFKVEGNKITAMIDWIDYHFGLVSSNIPGELFDELGINLGEFLEVTIHHHDDLVYHCEQVPFVKTFGDVAIGEPLLFVGETTTIEIAVNEDNMSTRYKLQAGPDWLMTLSF